MIKNLLSLYHLRYPKALVSLLHSSHYRSTSYLKAIHKTKDFTGVLEHPAPKTKKTLIVLSGLSLGMLLQIFAGTLMIILGLSHHVSGGLYFGIAIILLYPLIWAYVPLVMLLMRDWYKQGQSLNEN